MGSFMPPYVINSSKAKMMSKAWSTTASSWIEPAYSGMTIQINRNNEMNNIRLARVRKVSRSSIILLFFVVTTNITRFSMGWYTYLQLITRKKQNTSCYWLLRKCAVYSIHLAIWGKWQGCSGRMSCIFKKHTSTRIRSILTYCLAMSTTESMLNLKNYLFLAWSIQKLTIQPTESTPL